jgi:protein-tyrosine-phosphatase
VVFTTQLAQRGVAAKVGSAGFLGAEQTSPPEVATALDRWGMKFPDRDSRVVSATDLARADLVLGMERAHVREAVVLDASVWPKTFTLKELVRRASSAGPREAAVSEAAWLARIHADRSRSDLLGSSLLDDVADPYGKKLPAYEATTTEIVGLTARLIELMWPRAPRARG